MTSTTTPPTENNPLLHNRNFQRVFLAGAIAKLGSYIGQLAMPVIAVIALSAGPAQVGLLAALSPAAFLVLGLPAGVWVDRIRRRPVMIATDLARFALLISIPVTWWYGGLTYTQLCVVAFLVGVATVFFDIANQSFLPTVVTRRALTSANSAVIAFDAISLIGGRSVGGYLIELMTAPVAVVVNAFGYLWSALFIWRVTAAETATPPAANRHLGHETAEGVRHVFGHRLLRPIALTGVANNFALTMVITIVPVVFVIDLDLGAGLLGLFFAIGGVGSFLGAVVARRIAARLGSGRALWVIAMAVSPFALLVPMLRVESLWWIGAIGWAMISVSIGIDNVLKITFRQRATPDRLLGRMNATFRFLFTGVVAVGALAAGAIGELIDTNVVLWVAAAVMASTWLILFLSPIRGIKVLPEQESPRSPTDG